MFEAASRELREEVGFGARQTLHLVTLKVLPGHLDHETHVVLAEDLYAEKLPGDEPEDLEIIRCPVSSLQGLIERGQLREARTVAAFLLLRETLKGRA